MIGPMLQTGRFILYNADCMDVLAERKDESIDVIITDPPYGLGFMGKDWDALPPGEKWAAECLRVLKPGGHLLAFGGSRTWHRLAVAIEDGGFEIRDSIMWLYGSGFPKGKAQLKPAYEPIVVARKKAPGPWLNIDACRVGNEARPLMVRTETLVAASSMSGVSTGATDSGEITTLGRWPTNVVLDESQAEALDAQTGVLTPATPHRRNAPKAVSTYGAFSGDEADRLGHGDSGGASRFFPVFKYQAKAPSKERPKVDGIAHPTVKPLELMRWLVRLVTPENGIILDPFLGSGTTAEAALAEGFRCIGIERDETYIPLIKKRLGLES